MPETHFARLLVVALVGFVSMGQAKSPDLLTVARRLYNEGRYDEAITRATEAQLVPAFGPSAVIVLARARLERFRQTSDPGDMKEAREALKRVDAATLSGRDRVEFTIGLAESLFLDEDYAFEDRYSAAAEQFAVALAQRDALDASERELLFDWWALSLDRHAQFGLEVARVSTYRRIVAGAEAELAREPSSSAASYWLAAGACGMDELPRAWGAAVAAWQRAGAMGPGGAALRDDLDRLVVQMILPERARQMATPAEAPTALMSLEAQWVEIKARWQ